MDTPQHRMPARVNGRCTSVRFRYAPQVLPWGAAVMVVKPRSRHAAAYREHSWIAGTTSSQPLPENVEVLGGGSAVQAEHAGAINMWVQYNLVIHLVTRRLQYPLLPWIWHVVEIVWLSALMMFLLSERGSKHTTNSGPPSGCRIGHPRHATWEYSWISPPSRSQRALFASVVCSPWLSVSPRASAPR